MHHDKLTTHKDLKDVFIHVALRVADVVGFVNAWALACNESAGSVMLGTGVFCGETLIFAACLGRWSFPSTERVKLLGPCTQG